MVALNVSDPPMLVDDGPMQCSKMLPFFRHPAHAIVSLHLQFTNEIIYLVAGDECKQTQIARGVDVVYEMNADDSLDLQHFEECASSHEIKTVFIMQKLCLE